LRGFLFGFCGFFCSLLRLAFGVFERFFVRLLAGLLGSKALLQIAQSGLDDRIAAPRLFEVTLVALDRLFEVAKRFVALGDVVEQVRFLAQTQRLFEELDRLFVGTLVVVGLPKKNCCLASSKSALVCAAAGLATSTSISTSVTRIV
jgi:hypothetical protein